MYKIKEDEKPTELKLTKEEPIQTQFRLKPLNSKPSNHNLIEEINESDFDLFDKKLNKNYIKTKEKSTKPIKMMNHKLPNSSNSEEITQNINANSEFFTAKATTIVNTTPPAPSASSSTSVINPKTKLAKIVKADEEGFQNRKSKNYVYNNKKQDEHSSQSYHSSEDEDVNSKQQQQQKSKKGYEEFISYTRVESPHKLGKYIADNIASGIYTIYVL